MTNTNNKTNPPFLQSFNASAIILSYVGKTTRVAELLNGLSKSTAKYLEGHAPLLNEFVSGPEIISCLKFGPHEYGSLGVNW